MRSVQYTRCNGCGFNNTYALGYSCANCGAWQGRRLYNGMVGLFYAAIMVVVALVLYGGAWFVGMVLHG